MEGVGKGSEQRIWEIPTKSHQTPLFPHSVSTLPLACYRTVVSSLPSLYIAVAVWRGTGTSSFTTLPTPALPDNSLSDCLNVANVKPNKVPRLDGEEGVGAS